MLMIKDSDFNDRTNKILCIFIINSILWKKSKEEAL